METKKTGALELVLQTYSNCSKEEERLQRLKELIAQGIFKSFSYSELIDASRSSPYLSSEEERILLLETALVSNKRKLCKNVECTRSYERKSWFNRAVEMMDSTSDLRRFKNFGNLFPKERELLFDKAVEMMDSTSDLKDFEIFGKLSPDERKILFSEAVNLIKRLSELKNFEFFGKLSPDERKMLFSTAIVLLDFAPDLKEFKFFGNLSPAERELLFSKAIRADYWPRDLEYFRIFGTLSPEEITSLKRFWVGIETRHLKKYGLIEKGQTIMSLFGGFLETFF